MDHIFVDKSLESPKNDAQKKE